MRIARVVGTSVSTAKDAGLVGRKLLLCVRCDPQARNTADDHFVAVDTVGAGVGEVVLVALGSAARVSEAVREAPSDATVIGIIDSIELDGSVTYRKGGGGDGFDQHADQRQIGREGGPKGREARGGTGQRQLRRPGDG